MDDLWEPEAVENGCCKLDEVDIPSDDTKEKENVYDSISDQQHQPWYIQCIASKPSTYKIVTEDSA